VTRVLVPQLNNFTFMFPSSPLLTQADDFTLDLMCQQEPLPPRCRGSPICECVHIIDLPLGATVELILVDQGERCRALRLTPAVNSTSPPLDATLNRLYPDKSLT
jgi:hypothetical protein